MDELQKRELWYAESKLDNGIIYSWGDFADISEDKAVNDIKEAFTRAVAQRCPEQKTVTVVYWKTFSSVVESEVESDETTKHYKKTTLIFDVDSEYVKAYRKNWLGSQEKTEKIRRETNA